MGHIVLYLLKNKNNKALYITRTIWVSCFPPCGTSCHTFCFPACRQAGAPAPKTNSQWPLHPDTHLRSASVGKARICTQLTILHHDKFLAPRQLILPPLASLTRDTARHSYNSQNLYLDGKKCATPSTRGHNLPLLPGRYRAFAPPILLSKSASKRYKKCILP
jgi:hypothetical protein